MRLLLSILGVLTLLSILPLARSFLANQECFSEYRHCRMKCKANEYAIRYCADWTICCRVKKREAKKKIMW
ncbi:beta-defensin 43 precursor [Rattus norvegicus]|uniref:Beta-defensin 43 n=1 Tax=Rattus norvegicus TaxID=10116 RepID=DFB43_RAT|nr:beta-defensin 43 precursor [Rattus norvegicus]Q32ZF3.1 RecName: Full=Beta-defensin 43; Short=BD-43; AltName: Full=Defensin, beta 43; Flags: Precursor [Rattus norvegicus]AAT51909.1 beta-defensin 43 [Rattus norvegicus]|eukprot:NP_001032617.1 beta-defensin 43 precursor [Rattus norvegicus]